jgi:hypothetical protein
VEMIVCMNITMTIIIRDTRVCQSRYFTVYNVILETNSAGGVRPVKASINS